MGRFLGPKTKYLRRFGWAGDKNAEKKGKAPRKKTDYGGRLEEKQKLKFKYGIVERQLKNYVAVAEKSPDPSGEALLRQLETRLDNVVYQLGWASTRRQARQFVNHFHVLVDGKRINIPSYAAHPGEKIELRKKISEKPAVKENMKNKKSEDVPLWLEREDEVGKILRLPGKDEISKDIDVSAVLAFYR